MSSLGGIAISVLNRGLRPFLAKWHPRLQDWESKRPGEVSPQQHEKIWAELAEFQAELAKLRQNLKIYAEALAKIAGIEE